jgi:hypothetical protein
MLRTMTLEGPSLYSASSTRTISTLIPGSFSPSGNSGFLRVGCRTAGTWASTADLRFDVILHPKVEMKEDLWITNVCRGLRDA